MLKLFLLGQVQIEVDGELLSALPSRTAEALLIYAAHQNQPVARERLAELLWYEREPKQSAANLRSILSSLRKVLGDHLDITRQTVAINAQQPLWSDTAEFARLLYTADGVTPTTEQRLQAAALYRGDFLAQFYLREAREFEAWALLQRERLRLLALNNLTVLMEDASRNGAVAEAIDFGRQILTLDPLRENVHRQLMWLLVRSGKRNAALQQYETCRKLLAAELDVRPTAATTALFERLSIIDFPPEHNLPSAARPLVGRRQELAKLTTQLLRADLRLITLFGPGGVGKTRLSLELGHHIHRLQPGRFLDGIYFVALATVSTVQLFATRIAGAIGVELRGRASPQEQLLDALREREVLLILDNFEGLLHDNKTTALLELLLHEAPHVKFVVTSRECLRLYEETIFDLSGLPTAADGDHTLKDPAAQLFLRLAQRDPAQLDAQQRATVQRICRMLEGVPLAIELAAAWAQRLPLAEIEQQIAHNLDFLTSRMRNVAPRHRSLRALFDHSWQLLSALEQQALMRLAAIDSSFDQRAARAIANTDILMLATLGDKSLLQQNNSRYAIHPLLREYASEQLQGAQRAKTERRLATYYCELLVDHYQRSQVSHVPSLEVEVGNLRRAWKLALVHAMRPLLIKSVHPLFHFYWIRGWFDEGIDLLSQALSAADDPLLSSIARIRRARLLTFAGDLAAASIDVSSALADPILVDHPDEQAIGLGYLAIIKLHQGALDQATNLAQQALHQAEVSNHDTVLAFSLNVTGGVAKTRGAFQQAQDDFQQALAIERRLGDLSGQARTLNNLGNLMQVTNRLDDARPYYQESSAVFMRLQRPLWAAVTLSNAGRLAWQLGDLDEARSMLAEALSIRRRRHDRRGVASSLINLSAVTLAVGDLQQTARLLREAHALATATATVPYLLEINIQTAALLASAGNLAEAQPLIAFSLHHPALTDEVRAMAQQLAERLSLSNSTMQQSAFSDLDSAGRYVRRWLDQLA